MVEEQDTSKPDCASQPVGDEGAGVSVDQRRAAEGGDRPDSPVTVMPPSVSPGERRKYQKQRSDGRTTSKPDKSGEEIDMPNALVPVMPPSVTPSQRRAYYRQWAEEEE